eukprot:scaffold20821_cov61-Phaeocystis_antarctica.AAC.1
MRSRIMSFIVWALCVPARAKAHDRKYRLGWPYLWSLGVFSRASFAIQPRPRLRTLLDGAGPQAPGVHGIWKSKVEELYTFRPRTLRNVVDEELARLRAPLR